MAEEAFDAYDFDGDSEWTDYLARVDIPAGRPYEETVTKMKRKWFKKNKDASLEVDRRSAPKPSASASKPPPAAASGEAPRSAPSSTPDAAPPGKEVPKTISGFLLRKETMYLLMSTWLCANVVAFLVPTSLGGMDQGYSRACNAAFLKALSKFFDKHGFSFSGIMATCRGVYNKEYQAAMTAQRVVNDANLHAAFIYFLFTSAPPIGFALIPIFLSSLHTICEWQSQLLGLVVPGLAGYLDPILQRFIRHGKKDPETGNIAILYWNAWANVAIVAVLFVELFTPARSFLIFIVYVQFLFIRHGSPDARHLRLVTSELKLKADAVFHHDSCPGFVGKGYDMLLNGLSAISKRTGGNQQQR